jgi:putative DNA primase/helicase
MDYNYNDIINQFIDEMRNQGLGPQDSNLIGDGEIHKYDIEGDKPGKKAGWYKLFLDENPNGVFCTYRDPDVRHKFFPKLGRKMTEKERKVFQQKINEQAKAREEELAKKAESAKLKAKEIWNKSTQAESHAYLLKKSIDPYTTRVHGRELVVPVKNSAGELTSLQLIDEDGDKIFLPGGTVRGSYFSIYGADKNSREIFLICEGFATGATLRAATDFHVIVAFNAGNLEPVAREMRNKFPDAKIVICADNDQYKSKNTGIEYGRKAAEAIGGLFCYPQFPQDDPQKRTDFNDMHNYAEIKELINRAIEAPKNLPALSNRSYSFIHVVTDWPFTRGKDKPVTNIENVRHLLKLNKITVNYDIIKKDLVIQIPGESYLIDTEKNDKFHRITSIAESAGIKNSNKIEGYVEYIGNQNPINPVAQWIESRPWDGVSRLQEFLSTVKSVGEKDPEKMKLKNILILKWMVSAIAAAYRPNGVSAHGVLVFTGDQYVGKTNWFKRLVPQDLRLTKDGMMLDPKDKDSVYQVVSNWIVELGEIDATFRKADIAQLKAFITKDEDVLRLPYARKISNFARRTVFFASVNDRDYLADPTGNRRFWTIEVAEINHQHEIDMQQVWAEVLTQFSRGMSYYLDASEITCLNEHNKEYEIVSPIEELLETKYDWRDGFNYIVRNLTATDIAIELGFKNPGQREIRSIARALRRKNIESIKAKGKTLYRIPGLKIDPKYQNEELWNEK